MDLASGQDACYTRWPGRLLGCIPATPIDAFVGGGSWAAQAVTRHLCYPPSWARTYRPVKRDDSVAGPVSPISIAVISRRISPCLCRGAASGRFALVGFAIVFAPGDPNRLRATINLDIDPLAPDDYALFHFPLTGPPSHATGPHPPGASRIRPPSRKTPRTTHSARGGRSRMPPSARNSTPASSIASRIAMTVR